MSTDFDEDFADEESKNGPMRNKGRSKKDINVLREESKNRQKLLRAQMKDLFRELGAVIRPPIDSNHEKTKAIMYRAIEYIQQCNQELDQYRSGNMMGLPNISRTPSIRVSGDASPLTYSGESSPLHHYSDNSSPLMQASDSSPFSTPTIPGVSPASPQQVNFDLFLNHATPELYACLDSGGLPQYNMQPPYIDQNFFQFEVIDGTSKSRSVGDLEHEQTTKTEIAPQDLPTDAPPVSSNQNTEQQGRRPPVNIQQGPPVNIQQGPPANIQRGPPVNIQRGPPVNIQRGPPVNIQRGLPTNVQVGSNQPFPYGYSQPHYQSPGYPPYNYPPPMGYNGPQPYVQTREILSDQRSPIPMPVQVAPVVIPNQPSNSFVPRSLPQTSQTLGIQLPGNRPKSPNQMQANGRSKSPTPIAGHRTKSSETVTDEKKLEESLQKLNLQQREEIEDEELDAVISLDEPVVVNTE